MSLRDSFFRQNLKLQRHSQGLLLALVLTIGISAAVLGTLQIRRAITSPFSVKSGTALAVDPSNQLLQSNTDTDGDALSDYLELSQYNTSPYLSDSDSDGKSDSAEVAAGTDPNCPEGQTCGRDLTPPAEGAVPPLGSTDGSVQPSSPPSSPSSILPDQPPSPEEIRALLSGAGIPSDTLQQLTDEQLLQVYQETVRAVEQDQP